MPLEVAAVTHDDGERRRLGLRRLWGWVEGVDGDGAALDHLIRGRRDNVSDRGGDAVVALLELAQRAGLDAQPRARFASEPVTNATLPVQ